MTHCQETLYDHNRLLHSENPKTPSKKLKYDTDDELDDEENTIDIDRVPVEFRNALARGLLLAGCNVTAVAKFLKEMSAFLVVDGQSVVNITREKVKKITVDYLARQEADMKKVFTEAQHVAVSFDGGTSKAFGLHLFVTMVFVGGLRFLFQPLARHRRVRKHGRSRRRQLQCDERVDGNGGSN